MIQVSQLLLLTVRGLMVGSVYALIALGFQIIYNTTGIINFAQGEFVMLAGVVAGWLYEFHEWPVWLACIAALAVVTLAGVIMEYSAIRPAGDAGLLLLIIITLGASIMLKAIASLFWGTDPFFLPDFSGGRGIRMAGFLVEGQYMVIMGAAILVMIILGLFFKYTRTGFAMRACFYNRGGARLVGIDIKRISTISFGMSAFLGGICGLLVTPVLSMNFAQGTMLGLKGFCAAILGGMGSPLGSVAGGLSIGLLEQFSCWFSSIYRDTLALSIVVIMLLLRPQGILGKGE
ncbi:branched-chain amino acid ABC transporter permease [bacterium]|nr:branched-chain amino acid ABC transporter permease [bacterium]